MWRKMIERNSDANDWGCRIDGNREASANAAPPVEPPVTLRSLRREEAKEKKGLAPNNNKLLQALAGDWVTLRAHRAHDRRIDVTIDGEKMSLYTV